MSDRSQVEEIKERLDIAEIAKGYLPSMRKAGRNYFALCPFHNEKSPSFSINSDLGMYKCFGCGETGDVITFIEKMEGLEFPEALEIAAGKAGVTLKQNFSPQDKERKKLRDDIIKANELAMKFFHYSLMQHPSGEAAREYVEMRKLRKEELEKFQIGYAPKSWDSLIKFLGKKGYDSKKLVEYGLAVDREGKIMDKFRGRLMFPIFSVKGEVVGFSGRIIEKDGYGPKYLNSPDTLVYNKSFLLYGIYQAKEAIRKENFAILAEGQIDLLSSHKVGIENIIAPLGTSLTEQQLKLLKRYGDTIYFSFDTDNAGEKALLRSLELAHRVGFEVKAVNIGDYTDADELIRDNPKLWPPIVAKAEPVIDNIIRRLSKRIDLSTAKGKTEFAKTILPIIKTLQDKIQQSHYLKKVAVLLDTEEEVIRGEYEKASVTATQKSEPVKEIEILQSTEALTKEEYVVGMLIQNKEMLNDFSALADKAFMIIDNEQLRIILEAFKSENDVKKIEATLDEKQKEMLEKLLLMPGMNNEDIDKLKKEVITVFDQLGRFKVKEKIKKLKDQIRKFEASGEDSGELIRDLNETTKLLKAI